MKITRRQLRRLIAEAFKQKVPLLWGPEGVPVSQDEIEALRQAGRQDVDLSSLTAKQKANLEILDQSDDSATVGQARQIYRTFGSTEPGTSPDTEEAFLTGQDKYLKDVSEYNIAQALEDIIINGNRNPALLEQLGFTRIGDLDHLNPESEEYEDDPYLRKNFEQQSRLLNKPILDLVFIDNDMGYQNFDDIINFLSKNFSSTTEYSPYTGGDMEVFINKDQKNVALLAHMMAGYAIITI